MLIRLIITIVIVISLVSKANSQQWASPGDKELRRDIELLKSYDIIDGPLNTWPISWKQITTNININDSGNFPTHVLRAIDRVTAKIPTKGIYGSVTLRATNEPKLIRGFSDTARSDADLSAGVGVTEENFEVHVNVNYRDQVTNNHVNFDNSYAALHLGNWSLYAGAMGRWWGPGQRNTLLLGTNARPMPSIGLRRNDPKAFKSKWLSWIGPWTWDMFVANMGDDRAIPDALMAGMRLGFEPINNFEVGLSRTMQLCGLNRPCDFNTWTKAIIAVGDLDNTGTANEPGNQLASIDLSYTFNVGESSVKLYGEGTAEDEHVVIPFQYSRLVGATVTNPIGENGDMLTFNAELSDSGNVEAWFFGHRAPGVMYNHTIYGTGHRYDGRTLGHSFDNDSKLASLSATYVRGAGDTYSVRYNTGTINWDNTSRNIVSAESQKYQSLEITASKTFEIGRFEVYGSIQSESVLLTQGKLPKFNIGFMWKKRL